LKVGEIDKPLVNFTNILQASFALISFAKKLHTQTVSREKLSKTLEPILAPKTYVGEIDTPCCRVEEFASPEKIQITS